MNKAKYRKFIGAPSNPISREEKSNDNERDQGRDSRSSSPAPPNVGTGKTVDHSVHRDSPQCPLPPGTHTSTGVGNLEDSYRTVREEAKRGSETGWKPA